MVIVRSLVICVDGKDGRRETRYLTQPELPNLSAMRWIYCPRVSMAISRLNTRSL
jgi:hypothetical protein